MYGEKHDQEGVREGYKHHALTQDTLSKKTGLSANPQPGGLIVDSYLGFEPRPALP